MNKPTVTIYVPAYNEEANISNLIKSLLKQRQRKYRLKNIVVTSDASTDRTVQLAKQFKDKIIIVLDNKTRLGKNQRVNEVIKMSSSDISVIIDADTVPESDSTIELLIDPIIKNSRVVYTSGLPVPIKSNTFIGTAIQIARGVWDKIRDEIKNGEGIYTCHGQLYALRTDFAKMHPYPNEMWTDSTFYYFTCIKKNRLYKPAKRARVLFNTPSTLKDHISQIGRYQNLDSISIKYFGDEIRKELSIPKNLLYKYKLNAFLHYPVHTLTIFIINIYAKTVTKVLKINKSGAWLTQSSTKQLIKNE